MPAPGAARGPVALQLWWFPGYSCWESLKGSGYWGMDTLSFSAAKTAWLKFYAEHPGWFWLFVVAMAFNVSGFLILLYASWVAEEW